MKRDSIAYFSLGHPYNISLKPPVTFSPYSVCEVRVNLGVNVIDTARIKSMGSGRWWFTDPPFSSTPPKRS
jgi:hypothetical protein